MIHPKIDLRWLRVSNEDCAAWAGLLDAAERDRAARFRVSADRDRFVLGRALLRAMLGQALRCEPGSLEFAMSAAGKPGLSCADGLAFNVSHSADVVMVAVGRVWALGVDVERQRPEIEWAVFAGDVFTPRERAGIAAAPDGAMAFTERWVLKEAFLKGLGTGFSLDPLGVEIEGDAGNFRVTSLETGGPDFARWHLHSIEAPDGYGAALAVLPFD